MIDERSSTELQQQRQTIIWGHEVEKGDFIKLPRTLTRLGRFDARMGSDIQPRHIVLILALASRRFRDQTLEVTWKDLGRDLGTKPDTVRRWAYQLRDMKLLDIKRATPARNPDQTENYDPRYAGVTISIQPFADLVAKAHRVRRRTPHGKFSDSQ